MTFLFGRLMAVFHWFEDMADTYSFLLLNPASRECVDFLCRKCFLITTKIPVCGKGQPSSSPFPPPPPTEVVFVANIKLTRCWRIFFNGSQDFVKGGMWGEELTSLRRFSAGCNLGDGNYEGNVTRGKKLLENKCRLMTKKEECKPLRFHRSVCSLTAVTEENKVVLNYRSSFL